MHPSRCRQLAVEIVSAIIAIILLLLVDMGEGGDGLAGLSVEVSWPIGTNKRAFTWVRQETGFRVVKEVEGSSIVIQHRSQFIINSGPAFPVVLQDAFLGLSVMSSPKCMTKLNSIIIFQMLERLFGTGSIAATEMSRLMELEIVRSSRNRLISII